MEQQFTYNDITYCPNYPDSKTLRKLILILTLKGSPYYPFK